MPVGADSIRAILFLVEPARALPKPLFVALVLAAVLGTVVLMSKVVLPALGFPT
jgi:hypothetical protein